MDFFSDISKRFSNAAKSVQKRTHETAELARLNGSMRTLKNERATLFATLGKTYYDSLTSGEGQEQMEFIVEQLDQLSEKEKALKEQIDKFTQQRRCPKCGGNLLPGANFCPKCGERIPAEEPVEEKAAAAVEKKKQCPNCGALRIENSSFCIVCGTPFEQAGTDEQSVDDGLAGESPASWQSGMEIKWPRSDAEKGFEASEEDAPGAGE